MRSTLRAANFRSFWPKVDNPSESWRAGRMRGLLGGERRACCAIEVASNNANGECRSNWDKGTPSSVPVCSYRDRPTCLARACLRRAFAPFPRLFVSACLLCRFLVFFRVQWVQLVVRRCLKAATAGSGGRCCQAADVARRHKELRLVAVDGAKGLSLCPI